MKTTIKPFEIFNDMNQILADHLAEMSSTQEDLKEKLEQAEQDVSNAKKSINHIGESQFMMRYLSGELAFADKHPCPHQHHGYGFIAKIPGKPLFDNEKRLEMYGLTTLPDSKLVVASTPEGTFPVVGYVYLSEWDSWKKWVNKKELFVIPEISNPTDRLKLASYSSRLTETSKGNEVIVQGPPKSVTFSLEDAEKALSDWYELV